MGDIRRVDAEDAPRAIGPYSQALVANGLVFSAGQIPIDPDSGEIVSGGIAEQTARVLDNLQAVLGEAGSSLDRVLKTTVYLADLEDYAGMNEVYAQYFGEHRPARSAVEVARLPKDVMVEIDVVAAVE